MNTPKDFNKGVIKRGKQDHVRLYLESKNHQNKKGYYYEAKDSWQLGHEGFFSFRKSAQVKLGETVMF